MAKCLLKMSLETPIVHIEDVYVTGLLAEKCGYPKQDIPGIYKVAKDPCNFEKDIVLMHGIKSDEQKRMQEIVSKNIRTRCKLNL
jgi:hypothetical protein